MSIAERIYDKDIDVHRQTTVKNGDVASRAHFIHDISPHNVLRRYECNVEELAMKQRRKGKSEKR